MRQRLHFLFLNIGHFLDHLFMLIFATVAALALSRDWGMSYDELIPYATPGFIAFGIFSLPAGWIADRWSRQGMMAVFFIGSGLTAMLATLATGPMQLAICLFISGMLAAIYHPVGLALVVEARQKTGMAIAINGVFGNLGVASAALITGYFIDHGGWRGAFFWPGIISAALGIIYLALYWRQILGRPQSFPAGGPGRDGKPATGGEAERDDAERAEAGAVASASAAPGRPGRPGRHEAIATTAGLIRIMAIVLFTTAVGSMIFQATTFALPKVLVERLSGISGSATFIGAMAFVVFAVASMAQLIVGSLLDRLGPRPVFMSLAAIQVVFFALMPGISDWLAVIVAAGFMVGAFGQIPINDYMIGRLVSSQWRASIYGARFVVAFSVLAATLPFIAWVHHRWGFDVLFMLLSGAAAGIMIAVSLLPRRLLAPVTLSQQAAE